MPKNMTQRQKRKLLSSGSPLSKTQQSKLRGEIRSGKVRVERKLKARKR